MTSTTFITIHKGPTSTLLESQIPHELAALALGGNTSQFVLRSQNSDFLLYHPFTQGGGPLYFDTLYFAIDPSGKASESKSLENNGLQGISGQYVATGAPDHSHVWLADSGKEYNAALQGVYQTLGYEEVGVPPQNYDVWPLGNIFKGQINPLTSEPEILKLTSLEAFNHSITTGDFNGDGNDDLLVSGFTSSDIDPFFWNKIGYVALANKDGSAFDKIHWIVSPNLSDSGTSLFGMSNVSASDLNKDGRDEIIFSGGSFNASPSDSILAVYEISDNGQFTLTSNVKAYGKWLSNPSYNSYLLDLDLDGYQDLVAYFGSAETGFEVLRNDRQGGFYPAGTLGLDGVPKNQFQFVRTVDFNEDGYSDLILDNLSSAWSLDDSPQSLLGAFVRWIPEQGFESLDNPLGIKVLGDTAGFNGTLTYVGELNANTHRFAGMSSNVIGENVTVQPYVFDVFFGDPGLTYFHTKNGPVEAAGYDGPVDYLDFQMLGTIDGDIVTGSEKNDFMNLLGGDDAADGGEGRDVLDGGVGSNFLSGGSSQDVFFLDGRGGSTTWSTITDFTLDDNVNIWGWQKDASQLILSVENDGAEGFKGATFHFDLNGDRLIDTSITFSGYSTASLPLPSEQEVGGNGYLLFA